ncbi:3-deoxy-D-manno-octulosonic acid transferase [Alteromonas sediminis]|uniref:3-deoxy-D-manno-octulosonic acid transferase n=1 Tax=Alteromonas sediminis TaxID=2259342 RepID=A0A3N5YM84_9ALTE|nr:lipid IV(A) 3-deoxy-D-manno-octulosonic acid transferase [Alteromonas sediminis]RPJ66411.1 3-deoxy-D-manno-octulosonic acid transferase [Alteromonas sediminis]
MTLSFRPSFSQEASRWLYSGLLLVLSPIVVMALFILAIKKKQQGRFRIRERFGFGSPSLRQGGYLFHCVSVGEVVSASSLIKLLMDEQPALTITITTTTPTGADRVKALFGNRVQHLFLPYDLPFLMSGLLNRLSPQKVIITEVELWPNMIHTCWRKRIPVCVLNARMTEKSAKRYSKYPRLFGAMLQKVTHVCAQGERDYNNYLSLGVHTDKLTLTNNIKFDQANELLRASTSSFKGLDAGQRAIFVAGSTHEPEESLILAALQAIPADIRPLLILVPRHPERFDTVAALLSQQSLPWCRSTEVDVIPENTAIVLLDEMGQLTRAYAIATVAFVGGSLANKGGHNALEPAAMSLPVLMGPHTYNNPVICQTLIEAKALRIVRDSEALTHALTGLLQDPDAARAQGQAGKQVLLSNQGAVAKSLAIIEQL